MNKVHKYFFSVVAILITFMATYNASAQCPPGLNHREYIHVISPTCTVTVHSCYLTWYPGAPTYGIYIWDIDYLGDGCDGYRDDHQILDEIGEDIMNDIISLHPTIIPVPPCPAQSATIVQVFAGDCRTEPVFVGYQMTPGPNGYYAKKYVTKNCDSGTYCMSSYMVCFNGVENVYTKLPGQVVPPYECGTTTIYCTECSPTGNLIVPCHRFCD